MVSLALNIAAAIFLIGVGCIAVSAVIALVMRITGRF